MLDSELLGYRFAVFCGRKRNKATNISEQTLDHSTDSDTIHIVPKVIGAGGKAFGWLQVIAGAILVGVGVFVPGMQPLIGVGAGLIAGGIASLLMPTPKMDVGNDDGNRPNNGFGGAVTTVAQGNPVPILYGERDVGGFVASAGIWAEDKA